MIQFLKNLLSGKNPSFYERFTEHHHRIRDAIVQSSPGNSQQREALIALLACADGTLEFSGWLVYGFDDRNPILTREELRAITPSQGHILFVFLLVGFIRLSLVSDQKLAELYVRWVQTTVPERISEGLARFSQELSERDTEAAVQHVVDVIGECFPRIRSDPVILMQVSLWVITVASMLKTHVKF